MLSVLGSGTLPPPPPPPPPQEVPVQLVVIVPCGSKEPNAVWNFAAKFEKSIVEPAKLPTSVSVKISLWLGDKPPLPPPAQVEPLLKQRLTEAFAGKFWLRKTL